MTLMLELARYGQIPQSYVPYSDNQYLFILNLSQSATVDIACLRAQIKNKRVSTKVRRLR